MKFDALTSWHQPHSLRFARVSCAFADDLAHAQRLYDAMSRLWFMPATPVLSSGNLVTVSTYSPPPGWFDDPDHIRRHRPGNRERS